MLKKPKNIQADAFMSAKFDEIVQGRKFKQSDIPNIVCYALEIRGINI